ncbi:MAG TPA: ABC transporter substrate-binding protein [Actinomycetota bacterium]|nr:ABC transporter substrate-binding protein [Actinomycetota bacterium]
MPSARRPRLAAIALAGAVIFGGCTSPSPPEAPPAIPGSVDIEALPRGGTVTMGVLGEPATLDPFAPEASDLTRALVRPLYPSLYRLLPDGTAVASLADNATHQGDTVRVTLIDAQWSDDSDITAQDVVASARRALSPSGFARFSRVEATDDGTITFHGAGEDWQVALATAAYVLPDGRPSREIAGGPLQMASLTSGLEIAYAPNPRWFGGDIPLDGVRVQFIENVEIMIELLDEGRLDVAAVPSSVNLGARLDEMGLEFDAALGWESVLLTFGVDTTTFDERRWFSAAIDRRSIVEGLVRDEGRLSNALHPRPGAAGAAGPWEERSAPGSYPTTVSIAAPVGDELLGFIQRALWEQLNERVELELLTVEAARFYGGWQRDAPADVLVVRASGAPKLGGAGAAFRRASILPLAHVETVLAWTGDVAGLAANPTFDGPLWNVEEWFLEESQG